jgi:ubiquinone/menaquinone biosynthesis C-methylase UbiE
MSLSHLYDTIAKYYAQIDFFHINSSAMQAAIELLQAGEVLTESARQILDLGSGDGKLLSLLHELYPHAQLTAVDASADMLNLLKARLPRCSTAQASITRVHQRLPQKYFDLITASFVCSYVGLPVVLKQAKFLLKNQGYLMLITTTREAFGEVQKQVDRIGATINPWEKILYYWMKKTLQKTKVPRNFNEIQQQAWSYGFEVIQRRQLITSMVFNNPQQAQEFAEKGGWAISLIDYPWMPAPLLKKIALQMLEYIPFPFHDQMFVEVVLLKARNNH